MRAGGFCGLPKAYVLQEAFFVPFGRRFFANKDPCLMEGVCVLNPAYVLIMASVSGGLKCENQDYRGSLLANFSVLGRLV